MTSVSAPPGPRKMPPVLGRLLSGTFWLALRTPIQAVCTLWTTRLILEAIGLKMGAFRFAWGFGFFQFLFEFGISSALQRQISESWTKGDRAGVDRAIACGMNFYTAMAFVQIAALLGVAYWAVPYSRFSSGPSYDLIIKLLWLQVVTAPCYGMSVVVSSVLQAARRYDFIPRLEVLIVIVRFLLLLVGVKLKVNFFLIVVAQTLTQVGVALGPALWVMVRDLGHVPHFRGALWSDYRALLHFSGYIFLIQLSVVLADKIDTTILGFVLPRTAVEQAISIYDVVSKPFAQIRQTGWMLSYMVMPAVASLAAAGDLRGLDRIKYDGPRLHTGSLLPVALLAFIYAGPFLSLWVGGRLGHDAGSVAWLMQLFLIATIPLLISVHNQMAIGMGKVRVIAISALAGSLVNLPISYVLTVKLGVSGVIWGTVLTTLISNLLVPGYYVFRVLEIHPGTYLTRTLSAPAAGAVALLAMAGLVRAVVPVPPHDAAPIAVRIAVLLAHLSLCTLAYLAGYIALPAGRADLAALWRKLAPRLPARAASS